MHELLKILCFQFRVVTVEYFLDYMQGYEVKAYLENIPYIDRNDWEMCRYSIYSIAQMNSSKKIEATDLLKFPWDNIEEIDTTITNQDIERMTEKSKMIENIIKQ